MSLPWVEKYRPKSRDDLTGNEVAINGLFNYLRKWKQGQTIKSLVLIGPAGCGKTSSVYALANELHLEVFEVNASDTRKKQSLQEIVLPATQYVALDGMTKKRVILIDEVDGISGKYDRGGLNELIRIVNNSRYPVICTANDIESDKVTKLIRRKEFRSIEFSRLEEFDIFEILSKIAVKEGIKVEESVIEQIADSSAGDLRAAINELESHVFGTSKVVLQDRDKMLTLVTLFNQLFRSKNYDQARKVMQNAPSDYYKLLLFLYDITANQCRTAEEVAKTYTQLARADITFSRIMRSQNWSLLKYFFEFIGPGIALSRDPAGTKKITSIPNLPSSFIARGRANQRHATATKLAPKIAPKIHSSNTRFRFKEYQLVEQILTGNNGAEVAASLNLDDEEIELLMKRHPTSSLADQIVEARAKYRKLHPEQSIASSGSMYELFHFGDELQDTEEEEEERKEKIEAEGKVQPSLDEFF